MVYTYEILIKFSDILSLTFQPLSVLMKWDGHSSQIWFISQNN